MKYYLGLDNGGTTTKAAIFDRKGNEISVASEMTQAITFAPGFVERDMEEMWQVNCRVINKVLNKSSINPKDIRAMAVCGHGKGLYLWGCDNRPARYGIISSDIRATEYPKRWEEDGTAKKLYEITCQSIIACQPVSLLAWLRDNEPEIVKNIRWVFECKDYIRFRLTGEARAEITDYSGANLMNLKTGAYDGRILELLGLEFIKDALPPLCNSTEVCGTITDEVAKQCGLLAGTPVAGGMFDIDACALAVDVTDEDNICMIAGTWSINEYLRKDAVLDGRVLMNSFFCLAEYYLIEESSATSAGNNEWFIRTLLPEVAREAHEAGRSVYEVMNRWVEQVPDNDFCPIFLPFLMASNVHPNAKGCFIGLSTFNNRTHIAKSVYEGIAFSHRYHMEKLLVTRAEAPKCIRLAGGVTRSAVWTQMFADIMHLPVETTLANETGALGCAIASAVAVKDFVSLSAACKEMCHINGRIMPRSEASKRYDMRYQLYVKTIEALDSVWDAYQAQMMSI